ncbi:unnamed protein product [Protopolystoma xenopodis]|uniref:Uncharacterized protein n=1 Tax=Protopolystoma xenopodis TaxID=117903 RepID=A0A3S5CG84_9PLAT|nr:unnamed protein product [Protopolystoma xenopodis]
MLSTKVTGQIAVVPRADLSVASGPQGQFKVHLGLILDIPSLAGGKPDYGKRLNKYLPIPESEENLQLSS